MRRTESPVSGTANPALSRPVPSLPPRVPPRQATGGPPPQPPPRQNEYPDEHTPAPPPAYGDAVKPPAQSAVAQSATNRLSQAGVSVPGLGIGANATPPESPSSQGHPHQLSELQQRFARMGTNSAQQPAALSQETRLALQQQMVRPSSSGFAARQADSPPVTPTSPSGKKPPPPPPPKKSALSSTSAPAPPPLPLASKPRPG